MPFPIHVPVVEPIPDAEAPDGHTRPGRHRLGRGAPLRTSVAHEQAKHPVARQVLRADQLAVGCAGAHGVEPRMREPRAGIRGDLDIDDGGRRGTTDAGLPRRARWSAFSRCNYA